MQYANQSVATLLRRHPWAAEVLEWHGVRPERIDPTLSLGALCWLERLDPQRLVRDLVAAQPDETPEPQDDTRWWDDYIDYDIDPRWLPAG